MFSFKPIRLSSDVFEDNQCDLMMYIEKQFSWASKRTLFKSKFKPFAALRKSESFIGIEKRFELKYLNQYSK